MAFTLTFLSKLLFSLWLVAPILVFLLLLIALLGLMAGRHEGWTRFDALYWAVITALTIGYGDMRPTRRKSRALSAAIGLLGFMFTGIWVAATVNSITLALREHQPALMQPTQPPAQAL